MSLHRRWQWPWKGQAGYGRSLGLFAVTVIALAGFSIWVFTHSGPGSAEGAGAAMSLRVYADKDKSQLVCDKGPVHRKCEIVTGTAFSIDVVASAPPARGYTGYKVVLQYTSNLSLQQQPDLSENRFPDRDCVLGSEIKEPSGFYRLSCKLGERTTFSGPLANVQFVCDPTQSSGQIDLVGGAGANGSAYVSPDISGSMEFLKSVGKDGKEVADSVQVNCVDPTPTPTPTSTATPTPTPTSPLIKARMSLRVYADKAKDQLVCDAGPLHRKCNVLAGTAFSLDVVADAPPANGYTGYKVVLQYSPEFSLQQQPGISENRAPNCGLGSESKEAPVGSEPGRYILSCKVGPPPTTYSGPLANVQFVCGPEGGSGQIDLVGGDGAGVSAYIDPSIYGSMVFLKSQPKGGKQVADSVVVNCVPDSDGDGCLDVEELGPEPTLGGLRDPTNFWDFFDAPDPNEAPVRNRVININDIFLVAARFGTTGDPNGDPLTTPPKIGYHTAYDRTFLGPNPWDLGPPNGAIGINEIFWVAAQFAHVCAGL